MTLEAVAAIPTPTAAAANIGAATTETAQMAAIAKHVATIPHQEFPLLSILHTGLFPQ